MAGLLAITMATGAHAQTSFRAGVVSKLELTDGTGYGFRVTLRQADALPLSDCAAGFAFINVTHNNYGAITALLMSSYIEKRSVTLFVDKQASDGFCRIANVIVQ